VAHRRAAGPLLVAAVAEPRLDLAAEAAQRGRGQHALGCAADAHDRMDAGARDRARDRGGEVAVGDQLDPGAGLPDLGDQRLVPRPVEDHDRDVVDPAAERLGDPADVVCRTLPDVDFAAGDDRPDAQLVEVRVRGVGQAALLGRGEDGDCVPLAVGDEVGALERIDRDVDLWNVVLVVAADLLADVEHRRLVALALADDDRARELNLVHRPAHGLGRGLVGLVLLAPSHEPGRGERRRLGDADHLEREQLLHQWRKCRFPVKTIAM
jgi:hypothetical protein